MNGGDLGEGAARVVLNKIVHRTALFTPVDVCPPLQLCRQFAGHVASPAFAR